MEKQVLGGITSLIEKKIVEIDKILEQNINNTNTIGLYDGLAGLSLYFAYRYRLTNDEKFHDCINICITKSFEIIESGYLYHSFSSGFSGWAWSIEYLQQNNFIDIDSNELLLDINDYLKAKTFNLLQKEDYDILHGALGIVWYFITSPNYNKHQEYFEAVINTLETQSEKFINGSIAWYNENNKNEINLSLSHGLSSIICVLSKIYQKYPSNNIEKMINNSVAFLLSCKQNPEICGSYFPYKKETSIKNIHSRLAWCYGDLGIANALLFAGQALQSIDYINEFHKIALFNSNRKNMKEGQLFDAMLCHGVSGVAQMFKRFYLVTNNIVYKETSDYWILELLKMDTFSDGLAGYKQYIPNDNSWKNDISFLEGVSGIGMVLLSHEMDEDVKWDQSIILS